MPRSPITRTTKPLVTSYDPVSASSKWIQDLVVHVVTWDMACSEFMRQSGTLLPSLACSELRYTRLSLVYLQAPRYVLTVLARNGPNLLVLTRHSNLHPILSLDLFT